MNRKVSVIVPVYKVEQFLNRTVQSIKNQTLQDLEIILVDDGSPDRCPEMCDEWSRQYENIKVVHKENGGLGLACNSGLEVATGEYVAFCDSDDYVDKEMYQAMYSAAVANDADVVFTGIKSVDASGIVTPMNQPEKFEVIEGKEAVHNYLLDMIGSIPSLPKDHMIQVSAKITLYKRALLEKFHIRFESERQFISEDLIWHIDILGHAQKLVTIPESYYYYFDNSSSLTKQVRTDRFKFFKVMHREIVRRAKTYGLPDEVQIRADRMFIGDVRFDIGKICKSGLTFFEKRKLILDICKDDEWNPIWNRYPIQQMPFLHRVIVYLIKSRLFLPMYILFNLK